MNERNHNGWTPIYFATEHGNYQYAMEKISWNGKINLNIFPANQAALQLLLANGADRHIKNKQGKEARDLAVEKSEDFEFDLKKLFKPTK